MKGTAPATEDGLPNGTDLFSAVSVGRISRVIVDQIRQLIRQGPATGWRPSSAVCASALG
jgi:hypothetical protein